MTTPDELREASVDAGSAAEGASAPEFAALLRAEAALASGADTIERLAQELDAAIEAMRPVVKTAGLRLRRVDFEDIARIVREYDERQATASRCTGITAAWCPAHGDCSCPEEGDGGRALNDPTCPLHSTASLHGAEEEAVAQFGAPDWDEAKRRALARVCPWGIYDTAQKRWWPRRFATREEAQAHYDRCKGHGSCGEPREVPAESVLLDLKPWTFPVLPRAHSWSLAPYEVRLICSALANDIEALADASCVRDEQVFAPGSKSENARQRMEALATIWRKFAGLPGGYTIGSTIDEPPEAQP